MSAVRGQTIAPIGMALQAPSGAEIREQIRQSMRDAMQASGAAQPGRDAQQRMRDAQQHVRAAQQRLRDAARRSPEAARETALRDAESALRDAQAEARSIGIGGIPVVVHTGQLSPDMRDVIPPQAVAISIAFFVMCAAIIIGWPLARAFGRRIERRGEAAGLEPGLANQLQRIEQAVDAMAIEIERISESQRFMAKLQSEATQRAVLPTAERR